MSDEIKDLLALQGEILAELKAIRKAVEAPRPLRYQLDAPYNPFDPAMREFAARFARIVERHRDAPSQPPSSHNTRIR